MSVKVSDGRCLTPSLMTSPSAAGAKGTRRVVGMLESDTGDGRCRLVSEVRYDGRACRYRLDGAGASVAGADGSGTDGSTAADERWVVEEEGTSYRPFCHLILERLALGVRERSFRLHRLPGAPPSRTLTRRAYRRGEPDELVALDSCLTAEGGLWVEVAIGGQARERGWLPVARLTHASSEVLPKTRAA